MQACWQFLKLKATQQQPAGSLRSGWGLPDTHSSGQLLAAPSSLWQSHSYTKAIPTRSGFNDLLRDRTLMDVQVPGSGQGPSHLSEALARSPPHPSVTESNPPGWLHVSASLAEQPGCHTLALGSRKARPGLHQPSVTPTESMGQVSHQGCLDSRWGRHSSIQCRSGIQEEKLLGTSLETLYHHRTLESPSSLMSFAPEVFRSEKWTQELITWRRVADS